MNAPNNSPAAAQINEAIKNVAAMNNKVGGKRSSRKTRKQRKQRKQTRKNLKARKSTRRN